MRKIVDWNYLPENSMIEESRSKMIEASKYTSYKNLSSQMGLSIGTVQAIIYKGHITWETAWKLVKWGREYVSPFDRWIQNNGEQQDLIS